MGNPFLFADRISGAVVHLTTGYLASIAFTASQLAPFGVRAHPLTPGSDPKKRQESKNKMPAAVGLTQAFHDQAGWLNA
jgi:hypothetical protein